MKENSKEMNIFGKKQGYIHIDGEFVKKCDREFETLLSDEVKRFCDERNPRVIGLTGPTCSGKTTTAKKLIAHLGNSSKIVHVISLDDFFKEVFSREELERQGVDLSKIDFDSPDTLDIELFGSFVSDLVTKGRATKPIFDFKTGERREYESFVADDDDVFLFEGIQVLYPSVISVIEKMGGVVIGVRPMSAIEVDGETFEPDFVRLCRRIVRDYNFRGSTPEFTLSIWDGVRRNEEINIFPYFDRCDLKIDTVLPYELNVLAPYLRRILAEIDESEEHFDVCAEILKRFEKIEGTDSSVISADSLYREFV